MQSLTSWRLDDTPFCQYTSHQHEVCVLLKRVVNPCNISSVWVNKLLSGLVDECVQLGSTVLHRASQHDDLKMAALMIANNANLEAKNNVSKLVCMMHI